MYFGGIIFHYSGIAKSIGSDTLTLVIFDTICFDWNTLFSYVPYGSGRMVISVNFLDFFRCYISVIQDMLNDSRRSLLGY